MNAVVLGSRDQYCLNQEVMKLDNIFTKNRSCLIEKKFNRCPYYSPFDTKISKTSDYAATPIHDIEDQVTLGKKHSLCPYYASKALAQKADVVFVPYNYLIDKQARKSQEIVLKDAVVIIDEGHNIERALEEAASTELSSQSLAVCTNYLDEVIMELSRNGAVEEQSKKVVDKIPLKTSSHLQLRDVTNLNKILYDMKQDLDEVIVFSVKDEKVFLEDNTLYKILDQSNFDCSLLNVIDNIITYLVERLMIPNISIAINALQKLYHFLRTVYPDDVVNGDD
ncbi:regulator of telomere elongation helicase 1-like protein, partial [Leptotrombidium deliense]